MTADISSVSGPLRREQAAQRDMRPTARCGCGATVLDYPGDGAASMTFCDLCGDQLLVYGAGYHAAPGAKPRAVVNKNARPRFMRSSAQGGTQR